MSQRSLSANNSRGGSLLGYETGSGNMAVQCHLAAASGRQRPQQRAVHGWLQWYLAMYVNRKVLKPLLTGSVHHVVTTCLDICRLDVLVTMPPAWYLH